MSSKANKDPSSNRRDRKTARAGYCALGQGNGCVFRQESNFADPFCNDDGISAYPNVISKIRSGEPLIIYGGESVYGFTKLITELRKLFCVSLGLDSEELKDYVSRRSNKNPRLLVGNLFLAALNKYREPLSAEDTHTWGDLDKFINEFDDFLDANENKAEFDEKTRTEYIEKFGIVVDILKIYGAFHIQPIPFFLDIRHIDNWHDAFVRPLVKILYEVRNNYHIQIILATRAPQGLDYHYIRKKHTQKLENTRNFKKQCIKKKLEEKMLPPTVWQVIQEHPGLGKREYIKALLGDTSFSTLECEDGMDDYEKRFGALENIMVGYDLISSSDRTVQGKSENLKKIMENLEDFLSIRDSGKNLSVPPPNEKPFMVR